VIELTWADLHRRVLVTHERVKFADADPYGHLASGRYVDMVMSHRVEALEDLVGFSIVRYAASGVAFPARNVEVSYLRPAFVNEALEVASWLEELGSSSFEVRAIVSGAADRKARAVARIHFVSVDARTGRTVVAPATLPTSAEADPLPRLPHLADYVGGISGIPDKWMTSVTAQMGSVK
jgi:YbgC/YbaW family acyl-CoA thioester hydrolase